MTTMDNRALAYRVYEAINARDIPTLEQVFDPHVIRHAAREVGIESVRQAVAKAYEAFPEQRFVVEDVVAEGDRVALRVIIHGVPNPPNEPLPIIMEIFRIENGRVAEVWGAGTLRRH